MNIRSILLCASALPLLFFQAHAAIIVTTNKINLGSTAPTVSNSDLGQAAGTIVSALNIDDPTQLANGLVGNTDGDPLDPGEHFFGTTASLTFTFDVSTNTAGYDITQIDSVFGWKIASSGRSNQGYSIELTFVNDSTAFLVDSTVWEPNSPTSYWTVVSFTNNGGGALNSDTININGGGASAGNTIVASGVKAITFANFSNANAGGNVNGREFDIFGTATVVPEPSSIAALFGLASLFFLGSRRRK